MAVLKQNAQLVRQDKANEKEQRVRKSLGFCEYKIENDDIFILTGPYSGKYVKTLWIQGAEQRDYIYRNIYRRGDHEAVAIIKDLFVKC